jgi:hypothetical protein
MEMFANLSDWNWGSKKLALEGSSYWALVDLQPTQGDLYNLTTAHSRWTTWWRLFFIRAIPLFRLTVILVLVFVPVSHGYGASLPTGRARHTALEVLLVYNADSPISTAIAKEGR